MNDRAGHCGDDGRRGSSRGTGGPSRGRRREKYAAVALWVGVSTHNLEQLRAADATSADYIAVGPIFPTGTKANPDPVVGLEFLRAARQITRKPLVAIGGITVESAGDVYRAGADSIAVIRDLMAASDPAQASARISCDCQTGCDQRGPHATESISEWRNRCRRPEPAGDQQAAGACKGAWAVRFHDDCWRAR